MIVITPAMGTLQDCLWCIEALSCVRLFETPWTAAHQAPLSMEFFRQEYQSVLPFPSPVDLPDPGIEPMSPAMQADSLLSKPPGKAYRRIVLSCAMLTCSAVSDSFQPHGLQPTRVLCPWNSPGKNPGVDCYSLLQRIFPTQGSNPGLLHCRWILYQLIHKGQLS